MLHCMLKHLVHTLFFPQVRAVDFEIERQIKILESGGNVNNETRSFDILTKETVGMRDKEVVQVSNEVTRKFQLPKFLSFLQYVLYM